MAAYGQDLDRVARIYREQLQAWYERGEPVADTALYALLTGDFLKAIEHANGHGDLAGVAKFLRKHVSPGAWGDVRRVVLWEVQGGRDCVPKARHRRRA